MIENPSLAGWHTMPVGALCELVNGRAFKSTDWESHGLPIIRIQNLNNEQAPFNYYTGYVEDRHIVSNGDLLFAWSGTPGTSFGAHVWQRGRAALNQHIFRINHRTDLIDRDFLRYSINYLLDDLIANAHGGAGLAHITKKRFEATLIPLPPLPEQRRIVAGLELLFDSIRRARTDLYRSERLLQRIKTSILNNAFAEIEDLATWTPMEQLIDHMTSGSRDWAQYYDHGQAVFVLAANVKPMAFDPTPRQLVDAPEGRQDALRTLVKKEDLLITIVGAKTGDVCRVDVDVQRYYVCQSVALIRLADSSQARLVELFLSADRFGRAQIMKAVYGQGRPHLSFADIKALSIPVIPSDLAAKLVQHVDRFFSMAEVAERDVARSLALLDRLEQASLETAFRGNLVAHDISG